MMEFFNTYLGMGVLLYLVIGMLIIKRIEWEDDVNFNLSAFILCTITWLPIVMSGIIASMRGEK